MKLLKEGVGHELTGAGRFTIQEDGRSTCKILLHNIGRMR